MAKKATVGVEIGNDTLKICTTHDGRLTGFFSEDLPDGMVADGAVTQWEALGEFLKGTLKKNHVGIKHAALSLPGGATYIRRVRMPAMSPQQLDVNLPYEFHDFISDDKEHYIYDYSMIGLLQNDSGETKEMDLLGVAVSKQLMRQYLVLFKAAGLKLEEAAPECIAIGNVIRKLSPDLMGRDFAVLDLGYGVVNVHIFSSGVYMVTRTIETAGKQIINAASDRLGCDPHIAELYMRDNKDGIQESDSLRDIYDRISIDVMRAINYYTFENQNNTLETLYYCGGGAMIRPLVDSIAENSPLHLEPLSSIAQMDETLRDAVMTGTSALGICWNS